jgi:hypothetical protein
MSPRLARLIPEPGLKVAPARAARDSKLHHQMPQFWQTEATDRVG